MPLYSAEAYINTQNLLSNFQVLRGKSSSACTTIAMVKGNAYGHGLIEVCNVLAPYSEYFGVASLDEGIKVRLSGVKAKIIVFSGFFHVGHVEDLLQYQLIPIIHSEYQVDLLGTYFRNEQSEIWLKINTGMNRLGFSVKKFQKIYEQLSCHHMDHGISVITHLAESEVEDDSFTKIQLEYFKKAMLGKHFSHLSIGNSAAILSDYKMPDCNTIRPGISMYGISNLYNAEGRKTLKPVMSFQSRVVAIQNILKGESIGYNRTYIANKDMKIAVIPVGYGDGYPQNAPNGTPVLVNGCRCEMVGRISMDMMTVDITDIDAVKILDSVILWGEALPVEDVAAAIGVSPYALVTNLADRVRRIYV
jgi:alanine racemase